MHHKWKDRGLEVVTVNINLDEGASAAANAKVAHGILVEHKMTVTNLALEEPSELVADKLRVSGYPAVYVFDRRGRWTAFGGDFDRNPPVDAKKVDELVEKLLAEK